MRTPLALVVTGLVGCQASSPPSETTTPDPVETAVAELPAPAPAPASPGPPAAAAARSPNAAHPGLLHPERANETAPAAFGVRFETTKGTFDARCKRASAPKAADRLYNLVRIGFFDDTAFFRVVTTPRPFVVQFGIHGSPAVNARWKDATSTPDPVKISNARGTLTFAMGGSPPTFTTQLFINLDDNARLDQMGFAAVCEIEGAGMGVVEQVHAGYGEAPSREQARIQKEGNAFLRAEFPALDYVVRATIIEG